MALEVLAERLGITREQAIILLVKAALLTLAAIGVASGGDVVAKDGAPPS